MRDKGTFTITFDEQTLPVIEQISEGLPQCHLDKDDTKNSVCRNMYPVLFCIIS